MAGKGRRMSVESLEKKIKKQQETVDKAKAKFDDAKKELNRLIQMRDNTQTQELLNAIAKSKLPVADVISMVNEKVASDKK